MIISFYPSAEINFVEIHLCMLQCWLLKQSWKQTPCGGKEEGEQGEKKKKTENFGHSSRKASCVLWCSEKKKKGCVCLHPTRSHATRTDTLSELLPVQFSVSLPQRSHEDAYAQGCLSWEDKEMKDFVCNISEGYHRLSCLPGCFSDFAVKCQYFFSQWRALKNLKLLLNWIMVGLFWELLKNT